MWVIIRQLHKKTKMYVETLYTIRLEIFSFYIRNTYECI